VGPKTFPIIIGLLLGVSSLVMVLSPDPKPHWPNLGRLVEIGGAVLVLVAYALALPSLGFVIATALALKRRMVVQKEQPGATVD
jgi:putative tricarboxylic transport membrane protein